MNKSLADGLESADHKLKRGSQYIQDFIAAEVQYLSEDPIVFRREYFGSGGVMSYHVKKQPPTELGLIADDAIGNLREALDHSLFAFAEVSGVLGERDRKAIQFPTAENKAAFKHSLASGTRGIDARVVAAIEALEPWSGDGDSCGKGASLWQLHRRANNKKHRLLSTTPACGQHIFMEFTELIYGPQLQKFCMLGFTPLYGWSEQEPRVHLIAAVAFEGYNWVMGTPARYQLEMMKDSAYAAVSALKDVAKLHFA